MPEAIKEGSRAGEVAAPEDGVPAVDLATDGVVEVKPPPATEPSLPVDQLQPTESDGNVQEVGEIAPEVKEPPTEQTGADKVPTPQEKLQPKDELAEMITKGRALLTIKRDCYAAAEILSKACEKASEIFGELSDDCAELYYLYGQSMLECGKSENNVLGESVKDKDNEGDDDGGADEDGEDGTVEEEQEVDGNNEKVNEENNMEVDEQTAEKKLEAGTSNGTTASSSTSKDNEGTAEDVTKEDEEEDDDSSLKVAWEMLEMAKIVYTRMDNKEKLADTLMRLGEVGVESGHPTGVEDMIRALDIRLELFPDKRIIPETHFNIGLGYSIFEMFDEAITHFEKSKSLLEEMATNLETIGDEPSQKEAKEIRELLPELKDKIQDMAESKRVKRQEMEEAIKNGLSSGFKENQMSGSSSSTSTEKPAANISHLVKRKRKIDEVTSDLSNNKTAETVEEPKRKVKAVEKEIEGEEEKKISDENQQKKNANFEINSESKEKLKTEQSHEDVDEPMETDEVTSNTPVKTKQESEENPVVTKEVEQGQSEEKTSIEIKPKESQVLEDKSNESSKNEVTSTVSDIKSEEVTENKESDNMETSESLCVKTEESSEKETKKTVDLSTEVIKTDVEDKTEMEVETDKGEEVKSEPTHKVENKPEIEPSKSTESLTQEAKVPVEVVTSDKKVVNNSEMETDEKVTTIEKVGSSSDPIVEDTKFVVKEVLEKTEESISKETVESNEVKKTEIDGVHTTEKKIENEKTEEVVKVSEPIEKKTVEIEEKSEESVTNSVSSTDTEMKESKETISEVIDSSSGKAEVTESTKTLEADSTNNAGKTEPIIETSQSNSEEKTVTNGCKEEADSGDKIKTNLETAVVKEISKDEKGEASTVSC